VRITCFRSGKVSASPAKTRISLTLVELFSEHVPDTFLNLGTKKEDTKFEFREDAVAQW
jgi:hypothetical protein